MAKRFSILRVVILLVPSLLATYVAAGIFITVLADRDAKKNAGPDYPVEPTGTTERFQTFEEKLQLAPPRLRALVDNLRRQGFDDRSISLGNSDPARDPDPAESTNVTNVGLLMDIGKAEFSWVGVVWHEYQTAEAYESGTKSALHLQPDLGDFVNTGLTWYRATPTDTHRGFPQKQASYLADIDREPTESYVGEVLSPEGLFWAEVHLQAAVSLKPRMRLQKMLAAVEAVATLDKQVVGK